MNPVRIAAIDRKTTPLLSFTLYETRKPPPEGWEDKPLNLTSATVTFYAKKAPDSEETLLFSQVCTLDADPTTGKCSVRLTTTQTDTSGLLYCILRVVWGAGAPEHASQTLPVGDPFQIFVREAFA